MLATVWGRFLGRVRHLVGTFADNFRDSSWARFYAFLELLRDHPKIMSNLSNIDFGANLEQGIRGGGLP